MGTVVAAWFVAVLPDPAAVEASEPDTVVICAAVVAPLLNVEAPESEVPA